MTLSFGDTKKGGILSETTKGAVDKKPWLERSILDDVKKALGIDPDYDAFDVDILMHINTAFATLHQLNVGSRDPYSIDDNTETWSDFVGSKKYLASVRTYIFVSVRLIFDPPEMSRTVEALENTKRELEWRLNVADDKETP